MSIFKDYKKHLNFSADKAGTIYVNINNNEANLYNYISLNEYADCPFSDIGLTYSFNDRSTNGIFGYGVRLSTYKQIVVVSSTQIDVHNGDFSVDSYTYNSSSGRYVNLESKTYIVLENSQYKIVDKYGNYYKYDATHLDYPKYYYNKKDNVTSYLINFYNNKPDYMNGINATRIFFDYTSNLVSHICIRKLIDPYDQEDDITPQTILDIYLHYTNSNLTSLTFIYYKDNAYTHSISIGYDSSQSKYIAVDDISTKKVEVVFSNNKVSSIREGNSSSISYSRYLYFNYNTYYTRIYSSDSDSNGDKKIDNYYYFDSDNKLMFTYNKDGLARYREYSENGKIKYLSQIEYTHIDANGGATYLENLFSNGYFDNGINGYVVSNPNYANVVSNTDFPSHLGSHMLNINGQNNFYMYQDIDILGIQGDIFTFDFWYSYGNYYYISTALPTITFTFFQDSISVGEKTINLKSILRNRVPFFQSTEIKPPASFSKIRIKINFTSSIIMYICGLCLYKKSGAEIIDYDNYNNITNITSGNSINDYSYDSSCEISEELDSSSNYSTIVKEGNIKTIKGLNNTKTEIVEDIKGTYSSKKAYKSNNETYLEEDNSYYLHPNYSLSHNFLLGYTDNNDNATTYTYNYDISNEIYDKAFSTPTTYTLNNKIKEEYEYDYLQNISKIKVSDYNTPYLNKSLEIGYDSSKRLSSVKCANNMKYEYEYAPFSNANNGHLIKYKYSNNGTNAKTLEEMAYYRDSNNINTNLLQQKTINGLILNYEYNDYYNLINIKYENITRHSFLYDDRYIGERLLAKHNYYYESGVLSDTFINEYGYDNQFRLEYRKLYKNNSLKETIKYSYDGMGQISALLNNGSSNIYRTYDKSTNMRGVNIEAVKYYFKKAHIFSCFFNEKRSGSSDLYKYGQLIRENESGVEELILLNSGSSANISHDGFITYYSYPQLSYNLNTSSFTICMYFKLTSGNSTKFLFSIGASNNTNYIGIRMNNSDNLELISKFNNTENVHTSFSGGVSLNEWHSLIFVYNNLTSVYYLVLDQDYKTGLITNYGGLDNVMHFGYKYYNGTKTLYINGGISFISYENSENLNGAYLNKFYLDENIYHNLYFNSLGRAYTGVDITSEYLNYNALISENADVFPLTSNFASIKGKNALVYEYNNSLVLDRNPNFNYNEIKKSYCFESRGQLLQYDLFDIIGSNAQTQTVICVYVYPTMKNLNQTIFDLQLSSLNIKICLNTSGTLLYKQGNSEDVISSNFQLYTWHKIKFLYNTTAGKFMVNMDGTTFSKTLTFPSITKSILTLGNDLSGNPFYGQFSQLKISSSTAEVSNSIASKTKEYNELNLPISESIIYNDSTILSKNYTYDFYNYYKSYSRIREEKIGSDTYTYLYTNNFITEIRKNNQNYKKYTYDYCGYLTREENYDLNYVYSYEYDSNGNRTNRLKYDFNNNLLEELYYNYSTTYKDRLSSISGDINYNITYSSVNPYYISYIAINDTDIYISYEGANITSYTINTDTYTFKYNESNERIEKRLNNNVYTLYYYENHKLFREEIHNNTSTQNIYYLYDVSGILYGFIYEGTRYYYIRDCMLNIIGIINSSGVKLCDYKYDGFGNVTVTNYNNSNIGAINSIRYKGYYYDKEINLYYLINRYYNPYLGRFLTIDDPRNIDKYNINSLNLFTYCENNPIRGYDPEGEFIITISIFAVSIIPAIMGAAMLALGINAVVTDIEIQKAQKATKESYSREEAIVAIQEIVGEKKVTPYSTNLEIENSMEIKSRYKRILVSTILSKTKNDDGTPITNRSVYNMSAEWLLHNIASAFHYKKTQSDTLNLDYDFNDNHNDTKALTLLLEGLWLL